MPKKDLSSQIGSIQYGNTETDDFEDIINTDGISNAVKSKIVCIPMSLLVEYNDKQFESLTGRPQPFHAYSDEALMALAQSISEQGVINPITVRPNEDGKYQILAGRNRTRAARLAGKNEMPCIVHSDIDDVTAALIMLDTNLEQRQKLTYSEKAYAYKMRLDLKRSQGKRTDLQEDSKKIDTLSEIGAQNKQSRRTVAYLVRLTYLIPELLDMVDSNKLSFKIGVAISYLSVNTQKCLFEDILPLGIKIRLSQIDELKDLNECGIEDRNEIKKVFLKPQKEVVPTVTINGSKLSDYSDIVKDPKEIEKLFFEFLDSYRKNIVHSLH